MQTVNKSDCRPRLDGSEATACHPALTFALWEVHAEAATASRLSQTSHLRERNRWKGGGMGRRRKGKKVRLEDDQQWENPGGAQNRVSELAVSILLVASLTRAHTVPCAQSESEQRRDVK